MPRITRRRTRRDRRDAAYDHELDRESHRRQKNGVSAMRVLKVVRLLVVLGGYGFLAYKIWSAVDSSGAGAKGA